MFWLLRLSPSPRSFQLLDRVGTDIFWNCATLQNWSKTTTTTINQSKRLHRYLCNIPSAWKFLGQNMSPSLRPLHSMQALPPWQDNTPRQRNHPHTDYKLRQSAKNSWCQLQHYMYLRIYFFKIIIVNSLIITCMLK